MKTFRFTLTALGTIAFTLILSSGVQAQVTRTWVSGVGDDANPCSRTAPCRTLAGAIVKAAKDGEIDVLDPAAVGAVLLTKSIFINGTQGAGFAGVINPSSTGVNINITDAADVRKAVRIRGLDINGAATGLNGVTITAANNVWIDECIIDGNAGDGLVSGIGVRVSEGNGCNLFLSNTSIQKNVTGVRLSTTSGFVAANIKNCNIDGNTTGVDAAAGGFATIESSRISTNSGDALKTTVSGATINITDSVMSNNNGAAANASVSGSTIRVASSRVYNNGSSFLIAAGATVASDGQNRVAANAGGVLPNGAIPFQ
jgi:parallel beta helix pectate lyase-like protein